METIIKNLTSNWYISYSENKKCKEFADTLNTIAEIKKREMPTIKGTVPGNFELDLQKQGIIDDPFFGTNSWDMRKFENYHVWYYTTFDLEGLNGEEYLKFDGIDTVADIYVNGKLVKSVDNMFIGYEIPKCNLAEGLNELVVHIKPVSIYSRNFEIPASSYAMTQYMYPSLYVRKAPHMYGWDIMPRIVSCGIWKQVRICRRPENCIKDAFVFTLDILEDNTAKLCSYLSLDLTEDDLSGYRVEIEGHCGDSSFFVKSNVWHTDFNIHFFVKEKCKLWWPKGLGNPHLYDVEIRLYLNDVLCDIKNLQTGIRLVELENTYTLDEDGRGDFCFIVNRKRVFIKGTNWVPLDAFHSRDIERLPKALALLDDIGCNMVRCWGGNVYESDEFYNFCDSHGILVWQDFAMGCAVYPNERRFYDMLEEEVAFTVKRLRNHPSLALWSGDNEGDLCYSRWHGFRKDPNNNLITREILPRAINTHDFTRPYLASSPFISEKCFKNNLRRVEDHPWGARDYFRSDFYRNLGCVFASETGFYGMPSVKSLKKFISLDKLWPPIYEDGTLNIEWVAHSTSPERYDNNEHQPFAYFAGMTSKNIKELFDFIPDNLDDFVYYSQIFQAEAFKYVIEKFRMEKPNKTGVIWWNLINGWPQIDNGVVDYYYEKKLAYYYIKTSQQDVCLMMSEDKENIFLYGVNDTQNSHMVSYKVTGALTDEEIAFGKINLPESCSEKILEIPIANGEQKFLIIEWRDDKKCFKNHFVSNIKPLDISKYNILIKNINKQ